MTENERAITTLQNAIDCATDDITREDLKMAIKALEDIQAYRALGTVEDIETMKENGAFTGVELASLACMQMKLRDYQAIGTVEEIQKAIENLPLHQVEHKLLQEYQNIGTVRVCKIAVERMKGGASDE